MRRSILSMITLLFLLAACQEELAEQPVSPHTQGELGFSVSVSQTRGTPLMLLSEVEGFKVLAYQHTALWNDVSALAPATVFMDHISVSQTADNNWTYSPLQYWPVNGNLSFFGYSPEASTDSIPNAHGLTVTTPIDGSLPVITYTVPAIVEDQPDLLVVTSSNFNLNRSTDGKNAVNMQLTHALSCIGIKATGNGESISNIKISGIVGKGTINLGQPSVTWDINPVDTSYIFEAGVNSEPLDNIPSSTLTESGYLMMIPQTLTEHAKLIVTVDVGNSSYEQTFSLNIPGYEKWQAGQLIEYQLAISSRGSIILSPESIVLASQEKSYSSFTIICPEQNLDADWTASSPNGGWLEICDNSSGVNQYPQSTPYTYTGNGSTRLFAIAPAANISSAGLVSTITLDGTSQQIAVTQLHQDQVYIPKYPHDGWAGSNIYWVVDNSYPSGGYLTFDDKGETTHEQYQGVYFMWGSLVALSPMGNTWIGGIWNNGGGQILYIPNPDPGSNGGWNPALNSSWAYIPRLGWTNSSNPNGGGSSVSISLNDQQSYLIQNHSSSKNVGDICKYITDMGWAPGAKEGRKWRMPTHNEYMQLSDYIKEGTPFGYQQSNDPYGQMRYNKGFRRNKGGATPFFPNSGYRMNYSFAPNGNIETSTNYAPGESFSYWTSSPRATYGDAFDYVGINQSPTNTQGFRRDSGTTIRCVMENSD